MPAINTEVGKKIEDVVCEDCKLKIAELSAKLSRFDILRPQRVAKRFAAVLCSDCEKNVVERMRQLGKGGKR